MFHNLDLGLQLLVPLCAESKAQGNRGEVCCIACDCSGLRFCAMKSRY